MGVALTDLLFPLQPEHLGVLALAYNAADAPGRGALAETLLRRNFGVQVERAAIDAVLHRILRERSWLIALQTGPEARLQPLTPGAGILDAAQYVPAHWQGRCQIDDGVLERWKTYPTSCFTLARGRLQGELLLLKCRSCGAVYSGAWCWPHGSDKPGFPEGCHRPRGAATLQRLDEARWFFAVPQVCFETCLLKFCLLLAARGGVSWSALYVVYTAMFGSTFADTSLAARTHFVTALEMAAAWRWLVKGSRLRIGAARVRSRIRSNAVTQFLR